MVSATLFFITRTSKFRPNLSLDVVLIKRKECTVFYINQINLTSVSRDSVKECRKRPWNNIKWFLVIHFSAFLQGRKRLSLTIFFFLKIRPNFSVVIHIRKIPNWIGSHTPSRGMVGKLRFRLCTLPIVIVGGGIRDFWGVMIVQIQICMNLWKN